MADAVRILWEGARGGWRELRHPHGTFLSTEYSFSIPLCDLVETRAEKRVSGEMGLPER